MAVSCIVVSIMVVSDIIVSDIIVESDEPSLELFELQAATDRESAMAKKPYFSKFFIMEFFRGFRIVLY